MTKCCRRIPTVAQWSETSKTFQAETEKNNHVRRRCTIRVYVIEFARLNFPISPLFLYLLHFFSGSAEHRISLHSTIDNRKP